MTKPSTVSKLKANFVSLLPEDAQPQLEDIEVSVVRNGQIVSIMVQKKTFLLTALSTFNTFVLFVSESLLGFRMFEV